MFSHFSWHDIESKGSTVSLNWWHVFFCSKKILKILHILLLIRFPVKSYFKDLRGYLYKLPISMLRKFIIKKLLVNFVPWIIKLDKMFTFFNSYSIIRVSRWKTTQDLCCPRCRNPAVSETPSCCIQRLFDFSVFDLFFLTQSTPWASALCSIRRYRTGRRFRMKCGKFCFEISRWY